MEEEVLIGPTIEEKEAIESNELKAIVREEITKLKNVITVAQTRASSLEVLIDDIADTAGQETSTKATAACIEATAINEAGLSTSVLSMALHRINAIAAKQG